MRRGQGGWADLPQDGCEPGYQQCGRVRQGQEAGLTFPVDRTTTLGLCMGETGGSAKSKRTGLTLTVGRKAILFKAARSVSEGQMGRYGVRVLPPQDHRREWAHPYARPGSKNGKGGG